MNHADIVTKLSVMLARIEANPQEIISAVSTRDVLSAIAMRMGDKALNLKAKDLLQARAMVRAAIAMHDPVERSYIKIGLDAWESTRAAGPCDPTTTPTRSTPTWQIRR